MEIIKKNYSDMNLGGVLNIAIRNFSELKMEHILVVEYKEFVKFTSIHTGNSPLNNNNESIDCHAIKGIEWSYDIDGDHPMGVSFVKINIDIRYRKDSELKTFKLCKLNYRLLERDGTPEELINHYKNIIYDMQKFIEELQSKYTFF